MPLGGATGLAASIEAKYETAKISFKRKIILFCNFFQKVFNAAAAPQDSSSSASRLKKENPRRRKKAADRKKKNGCSKEIERRLFHKITLALTL